MAKLTTEEFIKKAREVHGDKYDYSKVENAIGTGDWHTILMKETRLTSTVPCQVTNTQSPS